MRWALRPCCLAGSSLLPFPGCSAKSNACVAGTIARAVQPPVHDVTDASVLRSWLNSPLGASLEADVFKVRGRRIARQSVRCKDTRRSAAPAAILLCLPLDFSLVTSQGVHLCWSASLRAAQLTRARLQATNVIRTFAKAHMMSPDRAIPAAVLREAAGFAILTVMKARLRCAAEPDSARRSS